MGRDYDYDREPCSATFSTGGFDPYGTVCQLQPGHTGKHRGTDPFGGGGFVEWRGGGSAGGDPLPYRDVEWVKP